MDCTRQARWNRWVLAVLLVASGGCASPGANTEAFHFATLITDGGLKLFQLGYPRPPRPERDLQRRQDAPERRRPEMNERTLRNVLEQRIQTTGYCRSGYLLLGRQSGPTTQTIRGECREAATDDDRKRFRNTISSW